MCIITLSTLLSKEMLIYLINIIAAAILSRGNAVPSTTPEFTEIYSRAQQTFKVTFSSMKHKKKKHKTLHLSYLHKLDGEVLTLRNIHLKDQKPLQEPDCKEPGRRSEP